MQQLRQVSSNIETSIRSKEFIQVLKMFAGARGNVSEAARTAKAIGLPRVAETLELVLKAPVTLGSLTGWAAVAGYTTLADAWVETLRSASVFDAMLSGGMMRVPLRTRMIRILTAIAGGVVAEGSAKPISSLTLGEALVDPLKVAAIVVISEELLRMSVPAANSMLDAKLRDAVVVATDTKFLADLIAATTPTASAGTTLSAILTDIGTLLDAVATGAGSRLFYILSPANMKALALTASAAGGLAFPNLGPNGGTLMPDVTAIASDQIASGAALLVDATAVLGNSDALIPDIVRHASLQLESTPDSPATASTVMRTLWQHDEVALRVERFFAYEIARTSAVASLSGVAY